MKKRKHLISVVLALVCTLFLGIGMTSCKGCHGDKPSNSQNSEIKNPSVTLSVKYLTLDLAGKATLFADVVDLSEVVEWSSSNPAVATVSEGEVVAVGEGTAEITARCGEYSDTCIVQVSAGGQIPVLKLNGDNAPVKLMIGTPFQVLPELFYNGEIIDEVSYTYKVVDENVATVDESGALTYKNIGTTEVQVKAVWGNFTVYEKFTVEYVSVNYMEVNNRNVELYTSNIFGDKVSETLSFTIVENGETVENPTISYAYDTTGLRIENNVVSVLKKQSATYEITATYIGENETMSVDFVVSTHYPIKNMESEYNDYELESMVENDINVFDCFTDGSSVVGVYDTEDPTVNCVENGKIYLNTKFYGKRSWIVHSSEGYGYQISGNVVTKIIRTAEEFQEIFMTKAWVQSGGWTTDTASTYYDGHYVLGNDIEFKNPTYNDSKYLAYDVSGNGGIPENAGFNGTFDGRGYTVSNIYLYSHVSNGNVSNGIFGTIGLKGVVKNVSFVFGGGCNWISCYLANAIAGRVDNVFIQVDLATYNSFYSSNMGVMAYRILPSASVTNTVTYLSGAPFSHAVDYSSGVHSFANRVDNGATLLNNYTVVDGYALAEDVSRYADEELKYYTADTLDDIELVKEGFIAEYWDLTDGLLPIMKSSLELSQPRLNLMSNFATSGSEVEISLNCFEHRLFDVVASAGTVLDGGNGQGQQDKKYILDLDGVSAQTVTVELKILGRTVDSVELEVSAVQEQEIDLNKRVNYTINTWNDTDKKWSNNGNDLTITGLTELEGQSITYAYVVNENGETQKLDGTTLNSTTLVIPNETLTAIATGDLILNVVAGANKYKMELSVVTAELSTEEQFVSIFLSSTWVGSAWKCDSSHPEYDIFLQEMTYGGYYVLTNNIHFSDTYYYGAHTAWNNSGGLPVPTGVGFNGILDGRGYTISNLGVDVYINSENCVRGIFGTIGSRGVIRNIAFVNGRMAGTSRASVASYLANGIAGKLENVFVHLDLSKSTIDASGEINIFSYGASESASFTNCVAYVTGTTSSGNKTVRVGNNWLNASAIQVSDCYVIAEDGVTVAGDKGFTQYTKTNVINGASFTTSNYGSAWDLQTYKLPVFTTAKEYVDFDAFEKA